MPNPYCDTLGIELPRLERVRNHPGATTFSLLIVALLERGGPMTLAEVAERLEQAGVGRAEEVMHSLRRCRPARAPVWRDGDHYGLDPHDAELDLRVFMLGLRPPRFSPPMRPQPAPLPKPDQRLTLAELDEAWKNAPLYSLSRQRLVLAVLDAHDEPMAPEKVISFVAARTGYHGLTADSAKFKRKGSSVEVRTDGRWAIAPGSDALVSARTAVRQRLVMARRWSSCQSDPAEIEARQRVLEEERNAHAGDLARLRRVIIHGFPAESPAMIVLLDVGERTLHTFGREELGVVRQRLEQYDVIAAIDVRSFLRAIDYAPGQRRLADLGQAARTTSSASARM